MAKQSHRGATWLLALVATVAGLVLVEVALRALRTSDPVLPSLYRISHPVLGWALQPGASYLNPFPNGDVRVTYNSAGWRDVERALDKRPAVLRIATLGDSYMEAYSVDLAQAFHSQLEERLRRGGTDAEVLNFGVGGYGTLQELLVYRDIAARYAPDVVLLGFCVANDPRDNSRELASRLENVLIAQHGRPFLLGVTGPWQITGPGAEGEGSASSLLRGLYSRSALLREIGRRRRVRFMRNASRDHPDEFELALHGVHRCEESPEYERAWEVTARILRRLRAEVDGAGGRLVVFTEPTFREADGGYISRAEGGADGRLCLGEAPGHRRLASILGDLGIPLIDLLPDFRRRLEQGDRLFRDSDRHWNAGGHGTAAERVAAELVRRGLLPPDVAHRRPAEGPFGTTPGSRRDLAEDRVGDAVVTPRVQRMSRRSRGRSPVSGNAG